MQKLKVVFVIWDDSCVQSGWVAPIEFQPGTSPILSVGFLVAEEERFLTITNGCTKDGGTNDPLTIPKVAVLKRLQINIPLIIRRLILKLWE